MSLAYAVLTCDCGRSITVPLHEGVGNDPRIVVPGEWYWAFNNDDQIIVKCPTHNAAAPVGG